MNPSAVTSTPTVAKIPAAAPARLKTPRLLPSSAPTSPGGFATICVSVVREPSASVRVLYTVKNGGIVVTTDPSAKVSVMGTGLVKVDVGRRVMVVLVVPLLWVRITVTEVTVDVGVLVTGVDGVSAGEDGSSLVVVEEPEPGGRVVLEGDPAGVLGLEGGLPVEVEEELVLVVVELDDSSSSPLLTGGGVLVEVGAGEIGRAHV